MNSSLDYFLGTYFHQDFNDEFGSARVLLTPSWHRSPTRQPGPRPDPRVLRAHPTEQELETYLEDLRCQYLPGESEGGYRGWLSEIARRVEAAT